MLAQFTQNQKTMSSREIAQLCEKEHFHVKRDCEVMFDGLNLDASKFGGIYFDTLNRQQTEYLLDEELTMTLVTGYSIVLRNRVIQRWKQLENKVSFDITNPAHLLQAIEIQAKQNIALKQELEIQAPKVAFVDKYVESNGNKTFRQVAKLLRVKENFFREFLESNKIMYRLNGEWAAFTKHINAKRFYVKTGVSDSGHAFNQTLFTPKGIEWIAGELAKSQVRGVA
jgi:phage antirepressor YoqD-like protein